MADRPLSLPDPLDSVSLHDMRVADTTVSLRFARRGDGVHTEVLAAPGGLDVVVE